MARDSQALGTSSRPPALTHGDGPADNPIFLGHGKLAIVVAGGPAPGINSVIGAATIRARLLAASK